MYGNCDLKMAKKGVKAIIIKKIRTHIELLCEFKIAKKMKKYFENIFKIFLYFVQTSTLELQSSEIELYNHLKIDRYTTNYPLFLEFFLFNVNPTKGFTKQGEI